jgi:hypothetical protein
MGELETAERQEALFPLLKPWNGLSGSRAKFFENELARELAPRHTLYGRNCTAIAITGESDDVLFMLDGGAFAQVHLTYTRNPPERPGFPRHTMFDTLADWMIGVMIQDHVDYFGLW